MEHHGTSEIMTILEEDLPKYVTMGWHYIGKGPDIGGWSSIWIGRSFDGKSGLEDGEKEGT